MHYEHHSDEQLLLGACRGDRGAFSALFRRHGAAVYRYAWSLMRENRDAEDLTQEVFVVGWRKRAAIRLVDQSALPWLLVTCRNLGRNAQRARRPEVMLDDSVLPGDRTRGERVEELVWVRHEIDRLGGVDRRVVHLCLIEGYSYAEAAEHLGLSVPAIAKRVERVRIRLRAALEGAPDDARGGSRGGSRAASRAKKRES